MNANHEQCRLDCIHNGEHKVLLWNDAHHLLHECMMGWIYPSAWFRHRLNGVERPRFLRPKDQSGTLFGFWLMTRRRIPLSIEDVQILNPNRSTPTRNGFQAQARRFASVLAEDLPASKRPYEHINLPSTNYGYVSAYRMKDQCTWFIILDVNNTCSVPVWKLPWHLMYDPPETSSEDDAEQEAA